MHSVLFVIILILHRALVHAVPVTFAVFFFFFNVQKTQSLGSVLVLATTEAV